MLKKREMRSEEKRLLDRMRMRKQRISNMRQKAKKNFILIALILSHGK